MDIWEWVGQTRRQLREEGHTRLEQIIREMSSYTCDDEHDQVDAIYPEGLALARTLENNWVELFLRHWHLQSKVLHRLDVEDSLRDAVDLLEYAHREENKDCPQSVCTTQDVACTYAYLDGPGYAQERLDVSHETLSRIDPSWPCYTCISTEYANALRSDGRPQEAREFLEGQLRSMREVLNDRQYLWRRGQLDSGIVSALLEMDELEEACELAERIRREDPVDSEHRKVDNNLMVARVWAAMGRVEEALELLPSWEVIKTTPAHYLEVGHILVDAVDHDPGQNTWQLGARLWEMGERLERQGVARQAFWMAKAHTELALGRGSAHIASMGLELGQRAAAKLRDPRDVEEELEGLEFLVANALERAASQPTEDTELTRDPEVDLTQLERGLSNTPEDLRAHLMLSGAWDALGFSGRANAVMEQALENVPASRDKLYALGLRAIEARDRDALDAVLGPHMEEGGELELTANWLYATHHRAQRTKHGVREGIEAEIEHLDAMLVMEPETLMVRLRKAEALRELGRWEEAWEMLTDQIERFGWEDAPEEMPWEVMVVGAATGNWREVRGAAARLGWEFEQNSDQAIDTYLETVKIHMDGQSYWSHKVSPVTARIANVAQVGSPQRFDALVVFDPAPLNPKPDDHPEGEEYHVHLRHLHTTEPSPWTPSWGVDGLLPQEYEALRAEIEDEGFNIFRRSGDRYLLSNLEDVQQVGFYGLLTTKQFDAKEMHERLLRLTQKHEATWMWPSLARAAGDEETAKAHDALMKQLKITP